MAIPLDTALEAIFDRMRTDFYLGAHEMEVEELIREGLIRTDSKRDAMIAFSLGRFIGAANAIATEREDHKITRKVLRKKRVELSQDVDRYLSNKR